MENRKRYLGDLVLFAASMMWGAGYYLQKISSETTSPLTINCISYLTAALTLLVLARFRLPSKGSGMEYSFLAGAITILAGNLQQFGLRTASIGNTSFITAIYIVLVPFMAALFLRRKIKRAHYLAVVLSIAGLYLVTTGGRGLDAISAGDMLVFAGSVFWAMQILVVEKGVSMCDPVQFTAGEFLTAGVLQFLVWLTAGHHDITGITISWPYMVVYGITAQGIAFFMQAFGQKHTGETEASIIMGLESVFGALAGAVLYHEQVLPLQLLGMALIFSAVLIAVLKS